MKRRFLLYILVALVVGLTFASCNKDDEDNDNNKNLNGTIRVDPDNQ